MLLEEAIAQNKIKPGQTIMVQPIGHNYTFTAKVVDVAPDPWFNCMSVRLSMCKSSDGNRYDNSRFIPACTKYKMLRINGRFA